MIKCFNKNEITKKDYNFIVSNLILSQEQTFAYDTLLTNLEEMFEETNLELKSTLSKCLILQ